MKKIMSDNLSRKKNIILWKRIKFIYLCTRKIKQDSVAQLVEHPVVREGPGFFK